MVYDYTYREHSFFYERRNTMELTKEETRFIVLMRQHPENVSAARRVLMQEVPDASHRPLPAGTDSA